MEMIRALPVGRAANLSAVLVLLLMANGGLAVFLTGGLVSLGIDSISLGGSLLYGIAVGSAGMIFGTVTLVAGQLFGSTVGTLGWSFAFLGLSYLLRAIGDVGDLFLTWCSPLGWLLETRVFVQNIWWPLLPAAGWIVLVAWLGFRLNASRDIGSGLIPAKAGRERGSRWLTGPFGLMLRIQRTSLISWAIGMLLLGVSYGSVFGDLEAFLSGNEELAAMLPDASGHSLTEQFMTLMMIVIAVLGTIPPLLFLHKVRSEEKKGTLEHLLAGPVSENACPLAVCPDLDPMGWPRDPARHRGLMGIGIDGDGRAHPTCEYDRLGDGVSAGSVVHAGCEHVFHRGKATAPHLHLGLSCLFIPGCVPRWDARPSGDGESIDSVRLYSSSAGGVIRGRSVPAYLCLRHSIHGGRCMGVQKEGSPRVIQKGMDRRPVHAFSIWDS
ncbi:ABC transporter permease [Rossellomorea sp. H39__3]